LPLLEEQFRSANTCGSRYMVMVAFTQQVVVRADVVATSLQAPKLVHYLAQ
jgi:hypothetical protein